MAKQDDVVRVPVTYDTLKRFRGGVKSPGVRVGPSSARTRPYDSVRTTAKDTRHVAVLAAVGRGDAGGGSARTAGMMLGDYEYGGMWSSGSLPAYQTSYATGDHWTSGTRDIPPYFVFMNEKNGGILYFPVSLREKYEWYRYFARTDAYVGRALELLTDLPMSKITLNMPKMKGKSKKLRREIHEFFEDMCDRLDLFTKLQSILWEYNMIGTVHVFHEWNSKEKRWERIVILPPEEVEVFQYPFSDDVHVEYKPQRLIDMILADEVPEYGGDTVDDVKIEGIVKRIPPEIKRMVRKYGSIVMDTDPMSGSFCYRMARRRSEYMDLGVSVLERVLVPMLLKEHYKYTQLSLSDRNMTPRNVVYAENISVEATDDLRQQLDLSMLDPDYAIVANYAITWDQIGADNRLLDLDREYEMIENQTFAGLGVTRELLTGEGTYSGNRITVEIMNTMFMLTRNILQEYVEKQLFRPVAEANGWYDTNRFGVKKYWYPKLGFNRLTIRDNAEVFDQLFQLYQKGSLPVDVIYEYFNLDSDTMHEKLYDDAFKIKGAQFNRLIEDALGEVGRALAERSDLPKKIAEYLKLDYKGEGGEGGEDEFGGMGGFGDGFGDEEEEDTDEMAEDIADELPEDATEEDIEAALEGVEV